MDERTLRIQQAVGVLIKNRRAETGLSQETLAAAVGLSRSSVANIESGRQKIGVSLLYIIADVLQTTPQELLPPVEKKATGKVSEVPLPKGLPKEEKEWIRRVLNREKKKKGRH